MSRSGSNVLRQPRPQRQESASDSPEGLLPEVVFYIFMEPLERVLGRLLEKMGEAGHRVLVLTDSRERLLDLNRSLWTYRTMSFLPHGCAEDTPSDLAPLQPVWLATEVSTVNNPDIFIVTDGRHITGQELQGLRRLADLNPQITEDETALKDRIKYYRDAGVVKITLWRQTPDGKWQENKEFTR